MAEPIKIDQNKIINIVGMLFNKDQQIFKIFETRFDKKTIPLKTEFVDPIREFKDLATDIVVNEYAVHTLEMSSFIHLIVSTFSIAIDYYAKNMGLDNDQLFLSTKVAMF